MPRHHIQLSITLLFVFITLTGIFFILNISGIRYSECSQGYSGMLPHLFVMSCVHREHGALSFVLYASRVWATSSILT